MIRIIKIYKTIDPKINLIAIFSLVFVLCYQLLFLNIPEFFPLAYEFGVISFGLTLAYLSSYIFYFIVVKIEQFDNKHKVLDIVTTKIKLLITTAKSQTINVSEKTNIAFTNTNITKEIFFKAFSMINSQDISPNFFYSHKKDTTWLEYFGYYANYSRGIIKEIYQFMPYLEIDLLVILNELEDSSYFKFFKPFEEVAVFTYPDLSVVSGFYYKYITIIRQLETYLEKVDKTFK